MVKKVLKKIVKKVAIKKKPAAKKAAPKKVAPVKKALKPVKTAKPIGRVTHFYGNIKVAIVKFNTKVPEGSELRFKGETTDFVGSASSMQYDHKAVRIAPKGKQVGIKVKKRVRDGDRVYFA